MPHSIQEYKWVVANCQQSSTGGEEGGGNLAMNFIQGGEVNYSWSLHAMKPE